MKKNNQRQPRGKNKRDIKRNRSRIARRYEKDHGSRFMIGRIKFNIPGFTEKQFQGKKKKTNRLKLKAQAKLKRRNERKVA